MIEGAMVARFIRAALVADAGAGGVNTLVGGRIFRSRVPQAKDLPAVTIHVISQPDHNTATGRHVYQDVQVDVAVRGDGEDYGPILPVAERIFAVLQGLSGVQDGVSVVKLRRVNSAELMNTVQGHTFAHLIQTFLTEAVPT